MLRFVAWSNGNLCRGREGAGGATARHSTPFRCLLKHSSLIIRTAGGVYPPVSIPPPLVSLFRGCPRRVAFLCCVSERFAAATHTLSHTNTLAHTDIQRVSVSGRNSARQKWAFVCANLYLAVDTPWQRCRPTSNTTSYNNCNKNNNNKQKTRKNCYLRQAEGSIPLQVLISCDHFLTSVI